MKKQLVVLVAIALVSCGRMGAQEIELFDNVELVEQMNELREEEEYGEALQLLERIPTYDTLYEAVLLDRIGLSHSLEEYENSLLLSEEGLEIDGEYAHLFRLNKGYALLQMDEGQASIESNDQGLEDFPHYLDLKYNTAIVHRTLGDFAKAEEILQEVLRECPYHAAAHYELAQLSLRENSTARAFMSLNTYLIIESQFDDGNSVIGYLEHLATSKKDSVPTGLFSDSKEDFSTIDLILDNGIALQKGYDIDFKEALAVFKQNHALFTGLSEGQYEAGGFWSELYAPLFKELMAADQFSNYCYYLLQFSAADSHKKMVSKKMSDIQEFIDWKNNYVTENWLIHDVNGETQLRTYNDNFLLNSIGPFDPIGRKVIGEWHYYGDNGRLTAVGSFVDGERDGRWTWYDEDTGNIASEVDFSEGEAQGEVIYYHPNGKRRSHDLYKNGKKDGRSEEYAFNGTLIQVKDYDMDESSGVEMNYYVNRALADSSGWTDNLMQGGYVSYYASGERKVIGQAKEGKRHGLVTAYHENGSVESEYTYVNGSVSGPVKEYYPNGVLAYEGEYEEDKRVGEHVDYRLDGTRASLAIYDENGKENGQHIQYDYQGNPHEVFEYSKGNLVAYTFLDDEGNEIRKAKKKGATFEYRGLNFNGTERSEGTYDFKGGKQGEWRFYDGNGILKSIERYEDNVQEGRQEYFHKNGQHEYDYVMEKGKYEGEYRRYYGDGSLRRHGMTSDGDSQGVWYDYHRDGSLDRLDYYKDDQLLFVRDFAIDGSVSNESQYDKGLLMSVVNYGPDGTVVGTVDLDHGSGSLDYVHINGRKKVDGTSIQGYNDGPFQYFEPTGTLNAEGGYILDERIGKWGYFHENGQLRVEEYYDHGSLHGDYHSWDWFGNIEMEGRYEYGRRVGKWSFYDNGILTATNQYVNGELQGERRFISPTGELQMVRNYEHGLLVSYSYEGPDGTLVEPIPIDVKEDALTSYFPNGKKAREYALRNSNITGELVEYMPDGNPSYSCTFIDGEQNGPQKYYHTNGGLYSQTEYKVGVKEGMSVTYWENGEKRLEIPYKSGSKHGTGKEYNEDGSVLKEYTFYNDWLIEVK